MKRNLELGLYLDTIRRELLDFDFEKLCSQSLVNLNVYACLVCGKYYQGRGKTSLCFLHSIELDHHVFMNLSTQKVYILPDGYEETDPSLDDIKYVLEPTFTRHELFDAPISTEIPVSTDLQGKAYYPGYVGLNNIKSNDYINAVVHLINQIEPMRHLFLLNEFKPKIELISRLGLLLRKMWNPKAFKGHVSPHELVQEISNCSKQKFILGKQHDAFDFLCWILNQLNAGLKNAGSVGSDNLVHACLQGQIKIETQDFHHLQDLKSKRTFDGKREVKTKISPFMFLSLDLPAAPLFQDQLEKNIIPQVSIDSLLEKYDGVTALETGNLLSRYKIIKLPKYLLLIVKRFVKNNFTSEKNPTIVNFPIKGLDMGKYLADNGEEARYDLVANVYHSDGKFKVHAYSDLRSQWFQIEDLVVDLVMPQTIILSESCIQLWKRR